MSRDLKLQVVLAAIDKATAPIRRVMQSSSGLGKQLKETRDQLRDLEKQQGAMRSFRDLKRGSEQSGAALQSQQRHVKELAQQLASTANPTKAMNREFAAATREAGRLKQAHSANTQRLQAVRTSLGQAGISTRNLNAEESSLRKKITETNSALAAQKSHLEAVAAQQQKLAGAKAQMERSQQLASSMATTGAAGLAAGGGALYAGARLLGEGMEFDSSMSKVQSLARLDSDSSEAKALREQARKLGADTMFSATEAAQGQGFLAMAGFTPQAILDAMPGVLDMAKAGDVDLAQTADIASNILSGMKLEAGDMGRVGDVLVGAFTRSNTSLAQLGDTMKYVAPVASSVGQDIETVAAMAGKLGDAGIQGGQAGTSLRSIVNRLSSPPKAALKAMDALGISAKDAQGNMRQMPDILTELYKKTKDMGTADRAGMLKAVAGEEAVSALQVLVDQAGSGKLQEFIQTLRDAEGEASATAKKMADNLVGDLDELSSTFSDVKIEIFEGQNSSLRELVQSMRHMLGAVGQWAKENPKLVGTIVKVVAVLAAMVAVGGAIMLTIGSILGPLAMLRYGMALFGVKGAALLPIFKSIGAGALALGKLLMANPIFLAIALLAAAAYLIYRNWDGIVGGMKLIWDEITQAFQGGIGSITALLLDWSPLGIFYRLFQPVLSWFGLDLPDTFSEFGANLVSGLVSGITSKVGAAKDAIVGVASDVTGWFKDTLGIRSPSRVFAALGGHTVDGLAVGIQAQENGPLKRIAELGKKLAAAAGLSIPLLAGQPAAALERQATEPSRPPELVQRIDLQQQAPGLLKLPELVQRVDLQQQAPGLLKLPELVQRIDLQQAPELQRVIDRPLRFDSRAPLQPRPHQAAAPIQPANITIRIHAAPGMDERALAKLVQQELEKAQRQQQVRQRSHFGDLE